VSSLLEKPLAAHGTVIAAPPGRVLMTYTDPERRVLALDGRSLVIVWPDRHEREAIDISQIQKRIDRYFTQANPEQLRSLFEVRAEPDAAMRGADLIDMRPKRKQIKEGLEKLILWIDRERMGIEGVSYGGQLTDWLITQTNEFKAAVPIAGISNLISYNYMTYYNQYEEMEFGQFLHQGNLMDVAWEHSALKHVAAAHTPTMLMHGENDNDVPIAEAEQFFIALKDVGTEAIFVRYPREGHGIRETAHVIDSTDRCIAWYEKHFPKPGAEGITNVQP